MALDGVILVVPTGAQILKGLVLFEYDRGNFRAVVVESGAASDSSATAAAPSWNPAIMANGQWKKSDKMAAVARPGEWHRVAGSFGAHGCRLKPKYIRK